MKQNINPINFLDCTLRDGGYYNNWSFNKDLVNDYLKHLDLIGIKYVEIGFNFLDKKHLKGDHAYCKNNYLNSLNIPKNINLGVMINASELVAEKKYQNKDFSKIIRSLNKIKFLRIACHQNEIFKLKNISQFLKKKKIKLIVNLMQVKDLDNYALKKSSDFLRDITDILYIADSFGNMSNKEFKNKIVFLKKIWHGDLGVHTHDNQSLALSNTKVAIKNGIEWVDCTVTGMGRGAGNVKTENLLEYILDKDNIKKKEIKKIFLQFVKKKFYPLKKKFKWGYNKFYETGAKNSIHPTYLQEILQNNNYKKKDYKKIIKGLKKINCKKFNPYNLLAQNYFFKNNIKFKKNYSHDINSKDIFILGPGKIKKKIIDIIKKYKIKFNSTIIGTNINQFQNEKLIDMRAFCHPIRISSQSFYIKKYKKKIIMPFSMLQDDLKKNFKKTKNILDYGFMLKENSFSVKKNYCIFPKPLVLSYAISVAINYKASKVYLAGFEGYKNNITSKIDTSAEVIDIIVKKYSNRILTLTESNYKLRLVKLT